MQFEEGNQAHLKYKTPEERIEVFEKLLFHLAAGWGETYFPEMDHKTIHRYLRDFPLEFPADQYSQAKREGQFLWEKRAVDGIMGKTPFWNAKTYQFKMMNQYGQTIKTETIDSSVQEIKDKIREQMTEVNNEKAIKTSEEERKPVKYHPKPAPRENKMGIIKKQDKALDE